MKIPVFRVLGSVAIAMFAMSVTLHADIIVTTGNDARVRFNGSTGVVDQVASDSVSSIEVGSHGGAANDFSSNFIAPFLLPTLEEGQSFGNANLTFFVTNIDNIAAGSGLSADLYGLDRISASDQVTTADHFEGTPAIPFDTSNTLLQDSLLNDTSVTGLNSTDSSGSQALTDFLNTQYAGGANAGQFVFLRINRAEDPTAGTERFRIATANNTVGDAFATITFDAVSDVAVVPEPSSAAVLIGLSGLVFARRRKR